MPISCLGLYSLQLSAPSSLRRYWLFALLLATCGGSASVAQPAPAASSGSAPTAITLARNATTGTSLPTADDGDFKAQRRGLIEAIPDLVVSKPSGGIVRDNRQWDFLQGPSPGSVNPALWRNAKLNATAGLFQVVEHVYQVRGFDGAVMSIVEGKSGIVVIDPLGNAETAAAALRLYYKHRSTRPVVAIVYTHAHGDHYGGAGGIVQASGISAEKLQVIAPKGFIDSVVSEWVLAGPLMTRRAIYMTGLLLKPGPEGVVDAGVGKASGFGTTALLRPTREIKGASETIVLDGVTFDFRQAFDVEAPAELTFYLPQYKALCLAELANQSMHQIISVRGTRARNALNWADALRNAAHDYGSSMKAVFVSHGWPHWEDAATYVENQADMYQYLHDQTLRMANEGLTPDEIAERLTLPPGLADKWYDRGYYGNVQHNVRGIYQYYFSWFDGDPFNLDPLPPQDRAAGYVAAMGGAEHVRALAQQSYDKGDYRWTIELLKQAVFADPKDMAARLLAAAAMRQLAYTQENALWRNYYLTGALELERGPTALRSAPALDQYASVLSGAMIFRTMAVRVDPARAADLTLDVPIRFTDSREAFVLHLRNAVLFYDHLDAKLNNPATSSQVIELTRAQLIGLLEGRIALDTVADRQQGVGLKLATILDVLSTAETEIPLVLPKKSTVSSKLGG